MSIAPTADELALACGYTYATPAAARRALDETADYLASEGYADDALTYREAQALIDHHYRSAA